MGLLGLALLNFMAEHRLEDMKSILEHKQEYPFAAAAINVASLIFEKLGFSPKTDLKALYHSSEEFNSPLMDFFCRVEDEFVFEEVFVCLMFLLDAVFAHMEAGYMQFPNVIKRVGSMFDELMTMQVVSTEQLRFQTQQRIEIMKTLS